MIPTLAGKSKGNKKELTDKAHRLIGQVGLKDHVAKYPSQMSIGECQRVAVVRALINSPKLLLADEPTGSLDESTAMDLSELLVNINQQEKVALIVVTHSMALADKMNRKLQLKQGKLYDRT